MKGTFVPQPCPLYAIPLISADFPARFTVADGGVQLVVGWLIDDNGITRPVLANLVTCRTPVFFEETRERAEDTAELIQVGNVAAIQRLGVLSFADA